MFLGHTYIFLNSFVSRNTPKEAGPQRSQREGGRPDQVGGRPAPVPLSSDLLCYGKYTYGNTNNPSDGKFSTPIDGSNQNKPLEALFDSYINRPLTSVFKHQSTKPSLLLQLELV